MQVVESRGVGSAKIILNIKVFRPIRVSLARYISGKSSTETYILISKYTKDSCINLTIY